MKQYIPRKLPRNNGYAELINFERSVKTDLAPYSCSYAMRRALYIHLHPNQERGELKNIAPVDHFSIPPSADGLGIPGLLDYVSLVYRYACMCIFDLWTLVTILAQGPIVNIRKK